MLLLALEFLCLICTQIRGSLLALSLAVIGVICVWLMRNSESVPSRVKKGILLAGAVFVAAAVSYSIYIGLANPLKMIGGERFMMWGSSFHMWLDHPLAGIGLDEWQAAYAEGPYHPAASREAGQVMPHNVFVYFFATAGTIGGAAYLAYCGLMLSWLVNGTKKLAANPFSWALLFMFIAATMHGLTDQTFILKLTGRIFYMLLAVGILFEREY